MKKTNKPEVRKNVFEKYGGKCAYCGTGLKGKFTIDHIVPLRRDLIDSDKKGSDTIENFNPCCYSCNSSKATYSLEKWRKEIYLKYERLLRDSSQFRLLHRFGVIPGKIDLKDIVFYFEKFNKKNL